MTNTALTNTPELKQLEAKWGSALGLGFVSVPAVLFRRQAELGLEANEVLVLLNLLVSWWQSTDTPYPRTSTIANRMGVNVRTVQRALAGLENKGFIRKLPGSLAKDGRTVVTRYDMQGTATKLATAAVMPKPASVSPQPAHPEFLGRRARPVPAEVDFE